ncbi:MAG: single-stranded DNA-binding protein, partial [Oscillospiraceae bacterium]
MLNKVILMGRLTADPEHKQTPNGVSVTSFSIAVERNFADKQTGKREADFINIVAWRGTADLICKYFSKGRMIALDGSLQTRTYQDK